MKQWVVVPHKCKVCRSALPGYNSLEKVCSIACAIKFSKSKIELEYKNETNRLKYIYKETDKRAWIKDAQKAFNRYIRARDFILPCISCGTSANIQYAAGHYFTVGGFPELRFDEDNVHKQCNKHCNMEKSGNIAAYRVGLLIRIGIDKLAALEGPHHPKKYTIQDLKEIKKKYNDKAKELEIVNRLYLPKEL